MRPCLQSVPTRPPVCINRNRNATQQFKQELAEAEAWYEAVHADEKAWIDAGPDESGCKQKAEGPAC
jgi:hypothetical protein